ncbi:integral membrane protein [Streptomyces viridochromogenes DSM 40736]|uniref:Integral membrane protein n=1 Tax=Streptomyces viridochromogenes (strain DSM 40736 / JCM 4977 / BCRC 1201 / Tue 494) TaxID=591159 RepID=D9X184_STRVT|nr:integral membrane protein [Streptomyces viridochromogenes DSM 40736]
MLGLACLLLPFGALATWAAHGLTDTGRYVRTMAPLAADPDVRLAVADAVGDGIMRAAGHDLDSGPLRGAAGPFVHDAVRSFTRTEAFRAAWDAANQALHAAVLDALRHDDARPADVTVDVAPVVARIKRQLTDDHVSFAHRIPVTHTRVPVLPAGNVDRLRKGYHVLDTAAFWLPLTAAVLAVAGIAVAACRRRAVAALGLGTALGGGLLVLAVAIGRRLTLADLPDALHRPAAGAVYDALTATLRTVSWLLLALGLAVALGSWLTGRYGRRAARRRARASAAPAADRAPEPRRARA